ncbi:MAG: methylated-DNA--[protein]-cysteine S-methyltransferase [Aestuariibacter sp.]|nr:methylated-DNA--[protein]-cysteine S-methyltransferase [Aestuariibacter sp.]
MDKEPISQLGGYLLSLRRLSGNQCDFWAETFEIDSDLESSVKKYLASREISLLNTSHVGYKEVDETLEKHLFSKLQIKNESLQKLFVWDIGKGDGGNNFCTIVNLFRIRILDCINFFPSVTFYFPFIFLKGQRQQFDLALDLRGTVFQKSVWTCLVQIPFGRVTSYSSIADSIKNPKAVRAVGAANGKNPVSIIVPCHRVIGSNGTLTGYAGGLERKSWLLKAIAHI